MQFQNNFFFFFALEQKNTIHNSFLHTFCPLFCQAEKTRPKCFRVVGEAVILPNPLNTRGLIDGARAPQRGEAI